MKKAIDIVEVINVPVIESQELLAFNLDTPETGIQMNAKEVEFRGWVLGKESPAIAVEVVAQGKVLKTIAVNVHRPDVLINYPQVAEAGISGFRATLDLSKIIDQQDQLTIYGILRDQSLVKMAEVMVKLGSDSSIVEVPLPQQDAESGVEGIQLKLQRIQANLERSKVFVQSVKTDLQSRKQLNNQDDGTVIERDDGMIARNPDFYLDRHNVVIEKHDRPSISFNPNNLEVYKKQLELQPNDINLHLQYGQELINYHKWEDAIATYQILVERQPNAQSYQGLGDALQGKEVFDQAIQAYRKGIEFNPENPHIYNNLGDALAKLGQIEEASAWYRCATELASKQKTFLV